MNTEPGEREYPDPKKSKAGRKGGLKRQENWRKGVKECDTCGKLSADLNEHPCFIAAHNAATRMRERCVGVVRARKYYDRGEGLEDEDPHSDNNPDYIRAAIDERLEDVAHDLESLTLDGEKEQ